jgi:hypothetical protein
LPWAVNAFRDVNPLLSVRIKDLPNLPSGAGNDYIDLANTYLFVEAQIMDDDDTTLDGGADVGPVNLWMHSFFSDVSVSLNENLTDSVNISLDNINPSVVFPIICTDLLWAVNVFRDGNPLLSVVLLS